MFNFGTIFLYSKNNQTSNAKHCFSSPNVQFWNHIFIFKKTIKHQTQNTVFHHQMYKFSTTFLYPINSQTFKFDFIFDKSIYVFKNETKIKKQETYILSSLVYDKISKLDRQFRAFNKHLNIKFNIQLQ